MPRPKRIIKRNVRYRIQTECKHPFWNEGDEEILLAFQRSFQTLKRLGYQFEVHYLEIHAENYLLELTPTGLAPINQLIQMLNSMVARRLNRYFGHRGSLWRQRYQSQVLENSEKFLDCGAPSPSIREAQR